jgi:hypothetical protein
MVMIIMNIKHERGYLLSVSLFSEVSLTALFALSFKAGLYTFDLHPTSPCKNKKSRAVAGAAFVNRDQVLGDGCNLESADIRIYHNFSEGFKSADMLEIYGIAITPGITWTKSHQVFGISVNSLVLSQFASN